ncbi:unnamed protein product [Symbiodinium necroappetens]|uniref:Peptidase A1 domain-containing protein n=1 Tax=Symbiodinium necroappetens TaxID=1628268 RepID=A0A812TN23_9DINO|nr:unnamed protein product [Symbiodinium necroappetens]
MHGFTLKLKSDSPSVRRSCRCAFQDFNRVYFDQHLLFSTDISSSSYKKTQKKRKRGPEAAEPTSAYALRLCGCFLHTSILPGFLPQPTVVAAESLLRQRRQCFLLSSVLVSFPGAAPATATSSGLVLPLEFERGAFLSFQVGEATFRGVADTGSPFLLVAACVGSRRATGRCKDYCSRYGCSQKDFGTPSGLDDNIVSFAGGYARAVWRCGDVKLGQRLFPGRTFGVLGETQSFGGNAGGPNFGLIKFATAEDTEIRPTFLSQTPCEALVFDFTDMSNPVLELTDGSPQQSDRQNTTEAFLTDLRPYGTGVQYYAVAVEKLFVDGVDILDARAPTVAILDTGTTGLVLPKSLFLSFDAVRRVSAQNVGIKRAGNVEVRLMPVPGSEGGASLNLRRGRIAGLDASLDIVTPLAEDAGSVFLRAEMREMQEKQTFKIKKKVERPAVIFLGLGFFAGLRCLVASIALDLVYALGSASDRLLCQEHCLCIRNAH